MDQSHPETLTQHAMLLVWGQFAQSFGLIDQIQSISLPHKTVEHSSQKDPGIPGRHPVGLEHLQDLSRSAHPNDQDQPVVEMAAR